MLAALLEYVGWYAGIMSNVHCNESGKLLMIFIKYQQKWVLSMS